MTKDAFEPVVGHAEAVRALRAHLERTGGSGSTLLVGPTGTGRAFLARRTAHAILGEGALIEAGNHPDWNVLEPAEGIAGVREATQRLQRRAARGPRQVLLVKDADELSRDALNALLKTLEEPPAGAAILLTARGTHDLPETVVSRCRVVRVAPLDETETRTVLARAGVPEDLAADAEGSPGRARYLHARKVLPDVEKLVAAVRHPASDPLGLVDKVVRRRKDEDPREFRRRLRATLEAVAGRLRRDLPESETALRGVVEALGSLGANASPGIVLSELVLSPWKTPSRPSA